MFFAVIGVVLLGILWGFIVSRGFRIFAVLFAQAELRARDQAAEEWLPRGRPSDRASQSRRGQD